MKSHWLSSDVVEPPSAARTRYLNSCDRRMMLFWEERMLRVESMQYQAASEIAALVIYQISSRRPEFQGWHRGLGIYGMQQVGRQPLEIIWHGPGLGRQAAKGGMFPIDRIHSGNRLAGIDGFKFATAVEDQVQCLARGCFWFFLGVM